MAIETPARIAVIGAGPIGLEAALYARYLGYDVDLYDRGTVADNVRRWGQVRMFTPFGRNRSPLGLAALRAQDASWQPPADDAHLTGNEYAARYLVPLAQSDLLVDGLHERTRVDAIGRVGLLPGEMAGEESRIDSEFRLLVSSAPAQGEAPRERFATADAVIDASGTYGNHTWLGPDGIPALGERAAQPHIEYGLPDILGAARERYAGRNILLVGDGDTAATNLVALAQLAAEVPDTWITWAVRRPCDERSPAPLVSRAGDGPERQRLALQANRLAADDANHVTFYSGTSVEAIIWHADLDRFAVRLTGKHALEIECDRVVANVGYRGDVQLAGALDVSYCPLSGAPAALGRALAAAGERPAGEGNFASAPEVLVTDEPDYYVLGAKSFGRDSRFTIRHGLDQVRALFTLIGDRPGLDLYASMKGLY